MANQIGYTGHRQAQGNSGVGAPYSAKPKVESSDCISFSNVYSSYKTPISDSESMLERLRDRFSGVSFSVLSANGTMECRNNSQTHFVQISESLLSRMANCPEEYKRVTEIIERWLVATYKFSEKVGGDPFQMHITIKEDGSIIKLGAQDRAYEDFESWREAWARFVEAIMEWVESRNEKVHVETPPNYEDAVA